ncbi:MAG: thioredoxin domain-containing protein, partial [Myxococcales bacterium]|nr:thioredoxin domain-containing protein [Myxococcales bacterium]
LARRGGEHLVAHHVDAQGRVLRAAFEGRVHTRGILDDVAFLGRACLDLHELTLEPAWLERARDRAAHALAHYRRAQGDGFYSTADDADALIDRPESQHDGPIPSGLGVMLELLLRLDAAEHAPPEGRAVAEAILRRFTGAAAQPFGYASLLTAARHASPGAIHVTVRGPSPRDAKVQALAAEARAQRLRIPHALGLSFAADATAFVVVCRHQTCQPPLTEPEALAAELSG